MEQATHSSPPAQEPPENFYYVDQATRDRKAQLFPAEDLERIQKRAKACGTENDVILTQCLKAHNEAIEKLSGELKALKKEVEKLTMRVGK